MDVNIYPVCLGDFLIRAADGHGQDIACIYQGENFTYEMLFNHSLRFSNILKQKGHLRGDRVVLYMDNSIETLVGIFGTIMAGGIFVIINPQTKISKLNFILEDCDAHYILTDDYLKQNVASAIATISNCKSVLITKSDRVVESDTPVDTLFESYQSLITQSLPIQERIRNLPTDLAALIYTSGSTGDPKGVMMTHQSMIFMTHCLDYYLGLSRSDKIINFLPLAFDYGLYQVFMSISLGATLVLEKSFAFPANIMACISDYNVSVFPGVPTVYKTLISMSKKSKICFPHVRKITNTAAALSANLTPDLQKIFPNAQIYKMYGLTECKRVCYLDPRYLDDAPDSVGKAIPGTEAYILSKEGFPVSPGETGILHVRGPHVMQGYWKRPQETAHMLKDGKYPGDKVLCTHDWFSIDSNGYLYFKGRSDDIIKTRGEKVSPLEVENCLDGIEGVKDSAVISEPDELWGEAIVAYIVLDGSTDINEHEIKKICRSRLESHMVPNKLFLVSELPTTHTGKIKKSELVTERRPEA